MKLTESQLTPEESARLAELEAIIIPGIVDCLKIGNALREISDRRLYRGSHTTFKEYVKDTYAIGVRTAYELVEHAKIVEQVKNDCANFAQTATPSQTRELKKVVPQKRAKVIDLASVNGPPTSRKLREAANAISPAGASPAHKDGAYAQEDHAGKAMPSRAEIRRGNLVPDSNGFDEFKRIIESACANVPEGEDLMKYLLVLSVEAKKFERRLSRAWTI